MLAKSRDRSRPRAYREPRGLPLALDRAKPTDKAECPLAWTMQTPGRLDEATRSQLGAGCSLLPGHKGAGGGRARVDGAGRLGPGPAEGGCRVLLNLQASQ